MNEYAARSEELKQAANMILQEASEAGIETRLLGGMAVYLTSPCTHDEPYARRIEDLDFAVSSKQGYRFPQNRGISFPDCLSQPALPGIMNLTVFTERPGCCSVRS